MEISKDLLDILVCPETKQRLTLLSQDEVEALNEKIRHSLLNNRAGTVIKEPIDGALRREDGSFVYPIRSGIPIMLIEEGIPVSR